MGSVHGGRVPQRDTGNYNPADTHSRDNGGAQSDGTCPFSPRTATVRYCREFKMRRQVQDIIWEEIHRIFQTQAAPLIAVDGRCAAGKTTFAVQMQKDLGCNVIHMDDFFLRPEQRTEERLRQPGGNIDWERFREEVLIPFRRGVPFSYRPYDCHMQDFREPVRIMPDRLTVVEGSYSCHPKLWSNYDLHIFLSVSPNEQLRRIQARNEPDQARVFQQKWIPLEERYFQAFQIAQRCELCFDEKS